MLFKDRLFHFNADTGNTGGDPSSNQADAAGSGDKGQAKSGKSDDPAGENETGKTFTQEELDEIIKNRLQREREKADKIAAKAKREAEEKSLAEQQQYQELAAKRQGRIEELEAENEGLKQEAKKALKYAEALKSYRDAMITKVPEPVQELLKGMDIADQLTWLSENAETVTGKNGHAPKLPNTPKPAGDQPELTKEQKRGQAYVPRF